MRILLVDDHPVVRRGIRQILVDGIKAASIGEAGDAPSAMAKIHAQAWDVIVVDITLPGASGLDLLKDIHRQLPGLPVLILSMHSPAQFARRVLAAGAAGYLSKDSAPTELVRAVEAIGRGQRYLGDKDAGWSAAHPAHSSPHDLLSDREYQVLRMLGSGLTVSEIAAEIGLSVKTVSTYRSRVLEKLDMRSSAELMRYAIENGLMDS
jgi:two-component system invasion response regulator UvrY